jgi:hypothetical protein
MGSFPVPLEPMRKSTIRTGPGYESLCRVILGFILREEHYINTADWVDEPKDRKCNQPASYGVLLTTWTDKR